MENKIRISLLKSEIDAQIKLIEVIFSEIQERKKGIKKNKIRLESLAYKIHNLYCAFEDLMKIVARCFENQIDDIARYHKELLKRMTLKIDGIRPALFSDETFKLLDELRSFRHFFRHAYSYEIKYEKVKSLLDSVDKLRLRYKQDIECFIKSLEA